MKTLCSHRFKLTVGNRVVSAAYFLLACVTFQTVRYNCAPRSARDAKRLRFFRALRLSFMKYRSAPNPAITISFLCGGRLSHPNHLGTQRWVYLNNPLCFTAPRPSRRFQIIKSFDASEWCGPVGSAWLDLAVLDSAVYWFAAAADLKSDQ